MKKPILLVLLFLLSLTTKIYGIVPSDYVKPSVVTPEGAWCWFADPRALHYENADGSINSTYIGYIDVHGNVKAMQYDFNTGEQAEVLVRSYFQPDDHNNPTFLVLPDERVMIFYSRHTDEPCFYYRLTEKKGDITTLGEEKRLATDHNTTYPSPFVLSDDPNHIYLCWRGINWHPTIAQLSMPDAQGEIHFTWGPHQLVKSTGARPYAKYQSNGKDKILLAYTTGHPDNEMPNHLYFNYININKKTVEDVAGNTLADISAGPHRVDKTPSYGETYPKAVVDAPTQWRDWLWQVTATPDGKPAIAMVRINDAKNSHHYYLAQWDGNQWQKTFLADAGTHFHQTPNIEKCYSGGMAIDPANPKDIYCSVPVEGANGKHYEIVKYSVQADGSVKSTPVTVNSEKNNARPYVIPGSEASPLRLIWMHGDYYDWIVSRQRPGYPTAIWADYIAPTIKADTQKKLLSGKKRQSFAGKRKLGDFSLVVDVKQQDGAYPQTLLAIGNLTVTLEAETLKPIVKVGQQAYKSSNRLVTADSWLQQNRSTNGRWYKPSLHKKLSYAVVYSDNVITTYVNGLLDQKIAISEPLKGGNCSDGKLYKRALNQQEIKLLVR